MTINASRDPELDSGPAKTTAIRYIPETVDLRNKWWRSYYVFSRLNVLPLILCEDALFLRKHTELKHLVLKGHNVCNSFSNRKESNLHSYATYMCMYRQSTCKYIKRRRYIELKGRGVYKANGT